MVASHSQSWILVWQLWFNLRLFKFLHKTESFSEDFVWCDVNAGIHSEVATAKVSFKWKSSLTSSVNTVCQSFQINCQKYLSIVIVTSICRQYLQQLSNLSNQSLALQPAFICQERATWLFVQMRANYLSAGGSCVQIKSEIALNAARDALGCSCNAIALECHRRLQESKSGDIKHL